MLRSHGRRSAERRPRVALARGPAGDCGCRAARRRRTRRGRPRQRDRLVRLRASLPGAGSAGTLASARRRALGAARLGRRGGLVRARARGRRAGLDVGRRRLRRRCRRAHPRSRARLRQAAAGGRALDDLAKARAGGIGAGRQYGRHRRSGCRRPRGDAPAGSVRRAHRRAHALGPRRPGRRPLARPGRSRRTARRQRLRRALHPADARDRRADRSARARV